MRRFKTKAQAQKYLDSKGSYVGYSNRLHIFKVPLKYRKGRHKIKPFAVTDEMDWIHFGF
tara:strand:+ start:813 stop:992 length:180 start_codon:yes stop_codon:yes gene_type:complete